jgi:hypothetical protein
MAFILGAVLLPIFQSETNIFCHFV